MNNITHETGTYNEHRTNYNNVHYEYIYNANIIEDV